MMEDIDRSSIPVIDDEETIREGCRLALEKSGHKICLAAVAPTRSYEESEAIHKTMDA